MDKESTSFMGWSINRFLEFETLHAWLAQGGRRRISLYEVERLPNQSVETILEMVSSFIIADYNY